MFPFLCAEEAVIEVDLGGDLEVQIFVVPLGAEEEDRFMLPTKSTPLFLLVLVNKIVSFFKLRGYSLECQKYVAGINPTLKSDTHRINA